MVLQYNKVHILSPIYTKQNFHFTGENVYKLFRPVLWNPNHMFGLRHTFFDPIFKKCLKYINTIGIII